jgi:hypothetical protein
MKSFYFFPQLFVSNLVIKLKFFMTKIKVKVVDPFVLSSSEVQCAYMLPCSAESAQGSITS